MEKLAQFSGLNQLSLSRECKAKGNKILHKIGVSQQTEIRNPNVFSKLWPLESDAPVRSRLGTRRRRRGTSCSVYDIAGTLDCLQTSLE